VTEQRDYVIFPYPADWNDLDAVGAIIVDRPDGSQYNKRAGIDRNRKMLGARPNVVLAFIDKRNPKSVGTRDMMKASEAAGIIVHCVEI
jgi:hypothetical protein